MHPNDSACAPMSLENVCVHRRLYDISLHLNPATMTVLLGSNGAGKSTLIHTLGGWLKPDSGAVRHYGRAPGAPAVQAALRAVLPQQWVWAGELTVAQLLADSIAPSRLPERVVNEIHTDLELTALLPKNCRELSGGQAQRVMLAKTALQLLAKRRDGAAQFLLLDEPAAALDVRHTLALLTTLKRWRERYGWGMLLALHDINQAAALADAVVLLKNGRLVAQGAPHEVLTAAHLRHTYDCDFVHVATPDSGSLWLAQAPAAAAADVQGA